MVSVVPSVCNPRHLYFEFAGLIAVSLVRASRGVNRSGPPCSKTTMAEKTSSRQSHLERKAKDRSEVSQNVYLTTQNGQHTDFVETTRIIAGVDLKRMDFGSMCSPVIMTTH